MVKDKMLKVLVGSTNPVKILAVEEAFSSYFSPLEVVARDVPSGVPSQPLDFEVFTGAKNRALTLQTINKQERLGGTYFIGIEGGLFKIYTEYFFGEIVYACDDHGKEGIGVSPLFQLPADVRDQVLKRKELGDIFDEITKEKSIGQHGGAIGYLTQGKLTRKDICVPAVLTALITFLNEELYFSKK